MAVGTCVSVGVRLGCGVSVAVLVGAVRVAVCEGMAAGAGRQPARTMKDSTTKTRRFITIEEPKRLIIFYVKLCDDNLHLFHLVLVKRAVFQRARVIPYLAHGLESGDRYEAFI